MKFRILRPMLRAWRSSTYRPGTLGWSLGIGMLIGFSPAVGLQTLICLAFCLVWNRLHPYKFNLPAMILGSLVVNPLTMAPTYLVYYQLGCGVVDCRFILDMDFFTSLTAMKRLAADIALPIVLGSLPFMIVALPAGLYLGNKVEKLLELRRRKQPERLRARERAAAERAARSTAKTDPARP